MQLWRIVDPINASLIATLKGHDNSPEFRDPDAVPVLPVMFSRNGQFLASGGIDHTVRLWKVADPYHPAAIGAPLEGHDHWVRSVAFSPDNQLLVSGGVDKTVHVWDVADAYHPKLIGSKEVHKDEVRSVAFSPNGQMVATGSGDRTARLWGIADSGHLEPLSPPLQGHQDNVTSVTFSPDGTILITGSDDHSVREWNIVDPSQPVLVDPVLTGPHDEVWAVAFSNDGNALFAGVADGTISRVGPDPRDHSGPARPATDRPRQRGRSGDLQLRRLDAGLRQRGPYSPSLRHDRPNASAVPEEHWSTTKR